MRIFRLLILTTLIASQLTGCSVFIPEHLLGNTNVVIQSMTPRVNVGSPVTLRVKYRVERFSEEKTYFMLVCSMRARNTCKASPSLAVPVKDKSGTIALSFAYSAESDLVLLVEGEPRYKDDCAADTVGCWPTYTNGIGSDSIDLFTANGGDQ